MAPQDALRFVEKHGVVLESASGPVPSLAQAIAGCPIPGSWWAHERSHEIFMLTRVVRDSPDVLVCRLVGGKVTFVHQRLWASLVRASSLFPVERLARIRELHTDSGRHRTEEEPFPEWVPPDIRQAAKRVSEADAQRAFEQVLP